MKTNAEIVRDELKSIAESEGQLATAVLALAYIAISLADIADMMEKEKK